MIITKGHRSFVEFLDKELPLLEMDHKYSGTSGFRDIVWGHFIESVKEEECHILFFRWKEETRKVVAQITSEPHTIVEDGESGLLKIEVWDKEYLTALAELSRKFMEIFGLEAEIIY